MKYAVLFLLTVFNLHAFASQKNWTMSCEKFPHPLQGGYCVHIPTQNKSNDIAYYLHGSGGSEFQWQDDWYYTAQLRLEWERTGAKVPSIVSISFGPSWLLAEQNQSPYSGLFDFVTKQFIPMVEQRLGGLNGRRIVFGESMGGYNSTQLALKTALFDKAGIICSPMALISPFSDEKNVRNFVASTSAWQYYKDSDPNLVWRSVNELIQLVKGFYPTQELWDRADPVQLASRPTSLNTKMYVAVGFYDRYAAFEGNEAFVGRLANQGMNVEWRPQWGGHCSIDIPTFAEFLVK